MNKKIIAIILAVVIISMATIGTSAYVATTLDKKDNGSNNTTVSPTPTVTSTTTPIPTQTSAPQQTTTAQPTTVITPTQTATQSPEPTIAYAFTLSYHEIERNSTTVTMQVTISNGQEQQVNVNGLTFYLKTVDGTGGATQRVYVNGSETSTINATQQPSTTTWVFQINYGLSPNNVSSEIASQSLYNINFVKT